MKKDISIYDYFFDHLVLSEDKTTVEGKRKSLEMLPIIMNIEKTYMNNPERIKMPSYVDKNKLIQHYYDVDRRNKFSLLAHVIRKESKGLVIIFCSTRHIVDIINTNLVRQNIKSQALHGGMTQNKRKYVIDAFHSGKLDVLVASDVAARGLDIKNVNLIINYDIPKTSLEYVHRIGRTARAGKEGRVISLLTAEDHDNFRKVIEDRSLLIKKLDTPHFESIQFIRPQRSFRPFNRPSSGSYHKRFSSGRRRYN